MIHRDLTPENLVLRKNEVILIDFGAANEFVGTATGTIVGKQAFIPPEQLRGKTVPESALYAFGGTMLFLLTGKDPLQRGQPYLADVTDGSKEGVVLKEFILPVFVDMKVRRRALEQFENEARILIQLDNKQNVKLIDFFVEDHRANLVLEPIRGASLQDIVKKQGRISRDYFLTGLS